MLSHSKIRWNVGDTNSKQPRMPPCWWISLPTRCRSKCIPMPTITPLRCSHTASQSSQVSVPPLHPSLSRSLKFVQFQTHLRDRTVRAKILANLHTMWGKLQTATASLPQKGGIDKWHLGFIQVCITHWPEHSGETPFSTTSRPLFPTPPVAAQTMMMDTELEDEPNREAGGVLK